MAVVTMYGSREAQFSEKQIKAIANTLYSHNISPDIGMDPDDAVIDVRNFLNELGIQVAVSINPSVINVEIM